MPKAIKNILRYFRASLQNVKIDILSYCKRQSIKRKLKMGNIPCLACNLKSPLYIVTLTSYGKRVNNMAHYAIASIFLQSEKPDKIVLYLDSDNWHDGNLPDGLKSLKKYGLEIHFCKDIKSYKKLIYAIQEFPNDILITADDDAFYPVNWLKKIKTCYAKNPNNICCQRAHEIRFDEKGNIMPYKQWKYEIKQASDCNLIFPTGVGGILYPPNALHSLAIDSDLFMNLLPTADDTWFWAMAKLQGTKTCLVDDPIRQFLAVNKKEEVSMYLAALNVLGNANDVQLKKVLEKFPQIELLLKKEKV